MGRPAGRSTAWSTSRVADPRPAPPSRTSTKPSRSRTEAGQAARRTAAPLGRGRSAYRSRPRRSLGPRQRGAVRAAAGPGRPDRVLASSELPEVERGRGRRAAVEVPRRIVLLAMTIAVEVEGDGARLRLLVVQEHVCATAQRAAFEVLVRATVGLEADAQLV